MNAMQNPEPPRNTPSGRMIPLTKWNAYHDSPPVGGLRWLVFNASQNGFDRVIKRRGRLILIDEAEYFRWIEDQS